MGIHVSRQTRLGVVIGISTTFFLIEISVGLYTRSLALVADAFHYLNDLIGFVVALVAFRLSEKDDPPKRLSFGWQRAQILGGFFNGVFLFAIGVNILLQSVEKFISLQRVQYPMLVFVVACIGLVLNVISAVFLHEHGHVETNPSAAICCSAADEIVELSNALLHTHRYYRNHRYYRHHSYHRHHRYHRHHNKPQKRRTCDYGILGILIHVIADAINNIGVMISALVIWFARYDGRFYADPAVSVGIAAMILLSSLPLVRNTGAVMLEMVPPEIDIDDVKNDLNLIPGILQVRELHVWQLTQYTSVASVHVLVENRLISEFVGFANIIKECFQAYGVHSVTIQPELACWSHARDGIRLAMRTEGPNWTSYPLKGEGTREEFGH